LIYQSFFVNVIFTYLLKKIKIDNQKHLCYFLEQMLAAANHFVRQRLLFINRS